MKIIYTDDFLENLEKILKTNPKLSNKITNIISNIKKY
jgi:Txe/YoeB family toxin of Txe-Axe toxin-antitoxin module